MKNILRIAFLIAAVAFSVVLFPPGAHAGMSIAAGQGEHTHSDASTGGGTLTLGGTLSSTKACAAGYTRVGPNFCHRGATTLTPVNMVRDTCVAVASPSADAKALMLRVVTQARSNNGVLQRFVTATFWQNAACSVQLIPTTNMQNYAYEHVAVAAATTLSAEANDLVIYSGNAGAGLWFFMSDDTGNQGTGTVYIAGYFD